MSPSIVWRVGDFETNSDAAMSKTCSNSCALVSIFIYGYDTMLAPMSSTKNSDY